jgi:phage gp36-like protein
VALLTVTQLKTFIDSERVTELSSRRDESVGTMVYDESIASTCITQAESLIKGMLSNVCLSSQVDADSGMQRMCADIALYYLSQGRGSPTDSQIRIYEQHYERLRRLQEGTEKLAAVSALLPFAITPSPVSPTVIDNDYFSGLSGEDEVL